MQSYMMVRSPRPSWNNRGGRRVPTVLALIKSTQVCSRLIDVVLTVGVGSALGTLLLLWGSFGPPSSL